jgi:predicted S18 family serine protease
MKKLILGTLILLTTVSLSYSQDSIKVSREDALRKIRQRDSLQVAKTEIAELKTDNTVLQNRIAQKDSMFLFQQQELAQMWNMAQSIKRESNENEKKFKTADARVDKLNQDLRRSHTKTWITGAFGLVATTLAFLIGSSHH